MTGWLQAGLRAGFLPLEALFDRVFGDRLNPLYHLGAIAFFLFWVVVATGLYLYAFFRTGVADAYASVESLTHAQWFAGGVLRSAHRYAADGMVLAMGLHALRHFAFERYRGVRAFSWITGVALVWGVVASGVNGYMLPWDRLAQFVVTGTFEWLDRLPLFGGTLIRNFISDAAVGDRLFSLLAFLHVGLPLGVLLGLWVHVQRVPRARTNPPRAVAIALLLMLLALAAVLPATSQGGPARMDLSPSDLRLDSFYLAVFPLLYTWSFAGAWALVVGGSVALSTLPWWPAGRGRERAGRHVMHVNGREPPVPVRAGEVLLDAGLRQGLPLPYACRSGGCGVCRCTVRAGRVDPGRHQPSALTPEQRARGEVLMCCATALEDLAIEVELADDMHAVREWRGRVAVLERLAPEVMRVRVDLPWGERLDHGPGQYVHVVLEDGQRRAFSIANAPGERAHLELHVRRIPGGRFTTHVFEGMRPGDELRFEGPLGGWRVEPGDRPLLFVAGATGFAPVKSIVEDAFARGVQRPMTLYWGVRRVEDAYVDLPQTWAREHPDLFRSVRVVSDEPAPEGWRAGLVHEAMLADHPDLRGCEVYVCGSARMVQHAVPAFLAVGLSEDACVSDAFVVGTS